MTVNVDDKGFCQLVPEDKPPVFCQEKDCLNCEVNYKYMPIPYTGGYYEINQKESA